MGTRRTIAIGLIATAVLALASIAARAQTKWDLSTVWPDGNFHTKNAMRFAQEVGKATNGSVEITVKAGGQLGFKGPEHLRAVRDGLVPMADVLNIQQIGDEPVLGTEGIPFLVASADELKVLHKHLRPVYEQVAARNNQKIIYMVPWPTQYLHLKVKVDALEGLKGIKIRVPDKGAADMLTASAWPQCSSLGARRSPRSPRAPSPASPPRLSPVSTENSGSSSSTATRPTTCGRARS